MKIKAVIILKNLCQRPKKKIPGGNNSIRKCPNFWQVTKIPGGNNSIRKCPNFWQVTKFPAGGNNSIRKCPNCWQVTKIPGRNKSITKCPKCWQARDLSRGRLSKTPKSQRKRFPAETICPRLPNFWQAMNKKEIFGRNNSIKKCLNCWQVRFFFSRHEIVSCWGTNKII